MPTAPEPAAPAPLDDAWLDAHPLPAPGSSKRDRGDVVIIGGARRTPGAVALAGLAALRIGAGRLTLAVAERVADPLAVAFPEAGVVALPETATGGVAASGARFVAGEAAAADAVVIGPGLDDVEEAAGLLRDLLAAIGPEAVVVLDAFALPAVAADPALLEPFAGRVVLTPNSTEAGLLLGDEPGDAADDARRIADRYGAIVSMRGLVAAPDGALLAVTAGGPVLGTSGSGDVLAGALAGLAARGASAFEAAGWATLLHARAGDVLSGRVGPLGVLARELADALPALVAERH